MQIINISGILNDNSDIVTNNGDIILTLSDNFYLPGGKVTSVKRKKYNVNTHTLTVVSISDDVVAHITLS